MRRIGPSTRLIGVAALCAVSACDSPSGLDGEGSRRLEPGQVVTTALSVADTTLRFEFRTEAGEEYAIYARALEGLLSVRVGDSANIFHFLSIPVLKPAVSLYSQMTGHIAFGPARSLYLDVERLGGGPARIELLLYRINRSPESVPATLPAGQDVTESIDPSADIDEFTLQTQPGATVIGRIDFTAAADTGLAYLEVLDGTNLLGHAFSTPLGPFFSNNTGRIVVAGNSVRFRVQASRLNDVLWYRGGYRIRVETIRLEPEAIPASIAPGVEYDGESVDVLGDVDEFTVSAPAAGPYNLFIQSASPGGPTIGVRGTGVPPVFEGLASSADTSLFGRATGRFQLPAPGDYRVRVAGALEPSDSSTGPYRFYVYAIDRAPEHTASTISPGDTIAGEVLDLPGDIDEFHFAASAGEEFVAFLQGRNSDDQSRVQLEVRDPGGQIRSTAQSTGAAAKLLAQRTPRFLVSEAGTHMLRVQGEFSGGGANITANRDVGGYRLLLAKINRDPEQVPVTLSLGDSVVDESIDVPGDVDEWDVTVSQPTFTTIVATEGLEARLRHSSGEIIPLGPGDPATAVMPGTYRLRVEAPSYEDRGTFHGPYKVALYAYQATPESVPEVIAIGDTVEGEAISPLYDSDGFRFYGTRGQHVNVAIQGMSPLGMGIPGSDGFQVWLTVTRMVLIYSGLQEPSLDLRQSNRLDIPVDGWYTITVSGSRRESSHGPYRLALTPWNTGPEGVSPTLPLGTTLSTEAIDHAGDWDEYSVTAPAGSLVSVLLKHLLNPDTYPFPVGWVFDPATGDTLGTMPGVFQEYGAGRITVPAGGEIRVAVYEPAHGGLDECYQPCGYQFTGPYRLRVLGVDPGPESVGSSLTRGTVVTGESIDFIGDLDTFTFTGAAGERVEVQYAGTNMDLYPGLSLEILQPGSSTPLASVDGTGTINLGPHNLSTGPLTLPAAGTYQIRVHGASDREGFGPFRVGVFTAP